MKWEREGKWEGEKGEEGGEHGTDGKGKGCKIDRGGLREREKRGHKKGRRKGRRKRVI